MVPVRIKKLDPKAIIPKYATEGAAGMDLHACLNEPMRLYQGQQTLIPTGLAMEIPPGYEGQIRPRSGLSLKHGITVLNAPGTVDSDFRSDIGVVLINHHCRPYDLQPGERMAQIVFSKVSVVNFEEVDELRETDRGAGGFGSTGK